MGCVMTLDLHVEVPLCFDSKLVNLVLVAAREISPGCLDRNLYKPFRTAGITGIIQQCTGLVPIRLRRNDLVTVGFTCQSDWVVLGKGDPTDKNFETNGLGAIKKAKD